MPERFLGIDTSNYRTSAAIYNAETGEWVNRGGLLTVPEGAIGLRQSDALFQHTVRLHEKIEALPQGEVRAIFWQIQKRLSVRKRACGAARGTSRQMGVLHRPLIRLYRFQREAVQESCRHYPTLGG